MEKVFEIKTPVGTGSVNYGEFCGKYKKEFHCWWGGFGIGGKRDNLEDAKRYLIEHTKEHLLREMNKLDNLSADIRIFLREI